MFNAKMSKKLSDSQISAMLASTFIFPPDGDADSDLDDPGPVDDEFEVNTGEDLPPVARTLGFERPKAKDIYGEIETGVSVGEAGDSTDSNFTISVDYVASGGESSDTRSKGVQMEPLLFRPRVEGLGLGGTQGYQKGERGARGQGGRSDTTSGGEDLDPRVRLSRKKKVLTKKSPKKTPGTRNLVER